MTDQPVAIDAGVLQHWRVELTGTITAVDPAATITRQPERQTVEGSAFVVAAALRAMADQLDPPQRRPTMRAHGDRTVADMARGGILPPSGPILTGKSGQCLDTSGPHGPGRPCARLKHDDGKHDDLRGGRWTSGGGL